MAKNWVRRRPRVHYDDVLSVAHERVVEAAYRYDPARGVPFPIFVAVQLRGAFADAARATLGRGLDKQLQQLPANPDLAEQLRPLWPTLPVFDAEMRDYDVERALAQLPPRCRFVLAQVMAGASQIEIAEALGVHQTRVSQVKSDAIARLRRLLGVPCRSA